MVLFCFPNFSNETFCGDQTGKQGLSAASRTHSSHCHLLFKDTSTSSVIQCPRVFTFTTPPSSDESRTYVCHWKIYTSLSTPHYIAQIKKQSHIALWMQKYQSTLYRKVLLTFVQLQTYSMLHTNTKNIFINQCLYVCFTITQADAPYSTVQEHFMVFFPL